MGRHTNIEWTDHTFNPWWGCTKVSAACDHCYAETWAKRLGMDIWDHGKPRRFLSDNYWKQPLKWNTSAVANRKRSRVFCASMADVFEWGRELSTWREKLWRLIEATPHLDWLLLTKRPHLVKRLNPWHDAWPDNVWLGTTVEDARSASKRIPQLIENDSRIRFLSCEPLLGNIDLHPCLQDESIDWVIAGGESGARARPSDPNWIYQVRDACIATDTAFLFKQWGDWAPLSEVPHVVPRTTTSDGEYSTTLGRFGKKVAGRSLEGVFWDGLPN